MSIELQRAIDLITDKSRWTAGEDARDVGGTVIEPNSPEAVCWCGWGAMCRTRVSALLKQRVVDYCRYVYGFAGGVRMSYTNDGPNGHKRVLKAMRAVQAGWKFKEE